MGPELEEKGRLGSAMNAPVNKGNGPVAIEVEGKNLTSISNRKDSAFHMDMDMYMPRVEQTVEGHGGENVEVEIVDPTHSGCNEVVEGKCVETTESSSSFDSISGFENGAGLSDAEVISDFHEDATSPFAVDGFEPRIRKKRLTSHWRTFIRPLAWRCRWVEMKAKKLKTLAHKYESELAEINQKKRLPVENLVTDLGTKSSPFSRDFQNFRVLKRKKRRRVEDTVDKKPYMSQHNLFAYYENRSASAGGASLDDDWSKPENVNCSDEIGLENDLLWLESSEGNESLEQTLRKIGILQGQVHHLKGRLDKVMSDNAGKFSLVDNISLLVPCIGPNRDLTSPKKLDRTVAGSSCIASQPVAQYTTSDVVKQETAVSSHGEVEDGILIYNESVKKEMNTFEEVKFHPRTEKGQQAPKEKQENTVPHPLTVPDPLADDQPAPKIHSISKLTAPKSKRRKGRRKPAPSRRQRS